MDKGRRVELTKLKYKKRLKTLCIKGDDFAFKHQAVPCSCYLCSHDKYKRTTFKEI